MNKFLLIDDDASRLKHYCDLFNFVEIEYLEDGNDFPKYMEKTYDGYIIDVVLDGRDCRKNNYMKLSFQTIIEKIPDNKPIFIVSSNWKEVMDGETMRLLVQSEKYKNILGYFS